MCILKILVKNAKVGLQWLTCISTIFNGRNSNKDSIQSSKRDGSFYSVKKFCNPTPTPPKNRFNEGIKYQYFLMFSAEKSENLGILLKIFMINIIFTG